MAKIVKTFKHEKTTSGAVMFREIDENGDFAKNENPETLSGLIYLRKKVLGGEFPSTITVTVEY